MKLNKNYYPSHKFNKLTPNFFLCTDPSMKSILKNRDNCDKNTPIKIEKSMTDRANLFCFSSSACNVYSINPSKVITKKRHSQFIKILPYRNLKVLKLVNTLSKQSYDNIIKYNFIFNHRFFYSQKKLWLCTYRLNFLFYETFIKINSFAKAKPKGQQNPSIDRKKKRFYEEIPILFRFENWATNLLTSNKKNYGPKDLGISNIIYLWIFMLQSQLLSEIFKCSVYGCTQKAFKIQKLLSKNWGMKILIFYLISNPILSIISIDFAILSKKKNKWPSQINSAPYKKSKSDTTDSNIQIPEKNYYELYKFKRLLLKYFFYVLFQPEWETKNSNYCYNIRPGATIYDCLDSIFQFYRVHDKTKHEFTFNTKISFFSNVFHSFRFIKLHEKSIQKETNFINNTIISSISIEQNISDENLNEISLQMILLSFLNQKYRAFYKKPRLYIYFPLAFSSDLPLSPTNKMTNQISDIKLNVNSIEIDYAIENQTNYNFNLRRRLIFKEKLNDSFYSLHNKIMLENLQNEIVDFILKNIYKEKTKTENKNQKQVQSLSHHYRKPFSFFKNSLIYKSNRFCKMTFLSYPLGIYSKKSYSTLLHRGPSLKIQSEVHFEIQQIKNNIKKNVFYNESDVVFEIVKQKQKRAPYNQLLLDTTLSCISFSYFFNYLLIQYGPEMIFLSSNKCTMTRCIEFFNRALLNTSVRDSKRKNQEQRVISNGNIFFHFNALPQTETKKNLYEYDELNLEGFSILRAVYNKQVEKNLFKNRRFLKHHLTNNISLFVPHEKNEKSSKKSLSVVSPYNIIRSHVDLKHKSKSNQPTAKKNDMLILLVASKSNVNNYLQQMKQLIKNSKTDAQDSLINKLAYKINLWCDSYKIVSNKQIFYYCDRMILKWLWRWSCRRHPNKNKNWILNKYFHFINKKNKKQTNQSRWNFCVYKNSTKSFYCLPKHSQIKLVRHLKIPEHYSIYDENWKYWLRRLS